MNLESAVSKVCKDVDIEGPLKFLASVMSGVDPRRVSHIWQLVQIIEEENFGDPPTNDQWEEIVEAVERDYEPSPVDLVSSQRAAITLAEYQHPKRKSVEVIGEGGKVEVPKLTDDELDLFEAWFNDQF